MESNSCLEEETVGEAMVVGSSGWSFTGPFRDPARVFMRTLGQPANIRGLTVSYFKPFTLVKYYDVATHPLIQQNRRNF